MNYKMVFYTLGHLLRLEGLLLILPALCALIYSEELGSFIIPIAILLVLGTLLSLKRPADSKLTAKDGFVIVALSWLLLSIFGMLPYLLSNSISSPVDAFFETASGFSTTGASVINDVEILPRGILFWRSFTNWIGGMGVLVFMLAVLPQADIKNSRMFHIMRAEVPGPIVGKLVSSLKHSAMIMYLIYLGLTAIQFVLLCLKIDAYDALLISFSTAGTGGLSCMNASIAAYKSSYVEIVTTVFMVLFAVNFNLYYFSLTGKVIQAIKSEELIWYVSIYASTTLIVAINILKCYNNFGEALRYSAFQTATIMSTTGFVTADFSLWPTLSQAILLLLMFLGGCAGSTCGGLKISRIIILIKAAVREIRYAIQPRSVKSVRLESKVVDNDVVRSTENYFILYVLIFIASVFFVSVFDDLTLIENISAVASSFNNIGPGLGKLWSGNFSCYSDISKIILSADMLLGRLELYPFLILLTPSTWKVK